jgi:hypothetical protein
MDEKKTNLNAFYSSLWIDIGLVVGEVGEMEKVRKIVSTKQHI